MGMGREATPLILDFGIIAGYFVLILIIGLRARVKKNVTPEQYFLSSRSLKWPSIAVSTIATNISAGHFMGMAGSAYVFGLAQANLEINAIFGILMATFFFVPLFLRHKVTTITQFFEDKLGPQVAFAYSVLMMVLYAFMYLGSALFWGAYAIDGLFGELLSLPISDPVLRLFAMAVALGAFSAFYTYLGGLTAVVRTDVAQFVLLLGGGLVTVFLAILHLGGWSQLWTQTGHLMHLHLPRDHQTLPWIGLFGMNLLNLNYWGANQVILQRALAAKDLRQAQVGLLVGGALKYLMALIVVIPGIALAGILRDNPLADPDQAYLRLVTVILPTGLRGVVLCGLFASLMSTVDSIYNSVSTMWSVDIYRRYLNPRATDAEVVRMARLAIVATLITGTLFAFIMISAKFSDQSLAFTHWFNELSYYVKNGFVLLILAAVFLIRPSRKLVLSVLGSSILLYYVLKVGFPLMNYFVRSGWVIVLTFAMVAIPTVAKNGWRMADGRFIELSHRHVAHYGLGLLASLVLCHVLFH
ncbi:MAG: SLC5 family protein [Acidobacteriota bacterium]